MCDKDDSFSLANWPTIHSAATDAKKEMLEKKTHNLIPLPAYDIQGQLIPPQSYKSKLPGSIAYIGFTLTHWFINQKNDTLASNTFTADITSIRIIKDSILVQSRRRERPNQTDPRLKTSPTKKRRIK